MQHREDLVEMPLYDRARRLQGVGVDAECELHGDVDGEAHQVAAQVHGLRSVRRPLPAPVQASHRHRQRGKEVLELRAVQGGGDDPALPAPVLAFGREDALEAHFGGHRLEHDGAPEPLGTLHQDALDGRTVRDHRDAVRPDADPEYRTVLLRPVFEDQVESVETDPMEVAQQRKSPGTGEIAEGRHCDFALRHVAILRHLGPWA